MKKKILVITSILCIVLMQGCGSSSEEMVLKTEYDVLVAENEQLTTELEEIRSNQLDEKTQELTDELPEQYIKAWTETTFGKSAEYAISNSKVFVETCAYNDYTQDTISIIWEEYISASKAFATLTSVEDTFNELTVIYRNQNGECILMITSKCVDGEWNLVDLSGSLSHTVELANALSSNE